VRPRSKLRNIYRILLSGPGSIIPTKKRLPPLRFFRSEDSRLGSASSSNAGTPRRSATGFLSATLPTALLAAPAAATGAGLAALGAATRLAAAGLTLPTTLARLTGLRLALLLVPARFVLVLFPIIAIFAFISHDLVPFEALKGSTGAGRAPWN
jgi:hypothetical protein